MLEIWVVISKPHSDHKAKIYSKYTKDRDKNIRIPLRKSSNHKGREQEKERNKVELQKQPENNYQNGNKHISINNYFKYKCINFFNKKKSLLNG